eukprot:TRINITY_DN12693_c0_g1_i1.p1 TRINITY_DN12693_c0_g1~~TRINITY_DN12693_c0_g1_i1.p1  ORF type:complete len:249 (+),score=67.70 TRINITY_DN12693_c0_g1_i1:31-747(+)
MSTKPTSEGSLMSIGQWRIHRAIENALDATVNSIVAAQNTKNAVQIKHLLEHIDTVIFFLHGHHDHEEHIVFPELRKKLAERAAVFDTLVGEHQQLVADLDNAQNLTLSALKASDAEQLSALDTLLPIMKRINEFLHTHFALEDSSFPADLINKNFTEAEQRAIEDRIVATAQKERPTTTFPLFLYNLPQEERDEMLKILPWIVRGVLVPWVWYYSSYSNYTQFYSYWPYGQRQQSAL